MTINNMPNPGGLTPGNSGGINPPSNPGKKSREEHTHDDLDSGRLAHHHTLGFGPYQAAPGSEIRKILSVIDNLKLADPPVGSLMHRFDDNDSTYWKLCNGQSLSVSAFPELFAYFEDELGDGYFFGGSAANFNLPDYGNHVLGMVGITGAFNVPVGTRIGALTDSIDVSHTHSTPNHTHTIATHFHTIPNHNHAVPSHNHTISNVNHSGTQNTSTGGSGTRVNTIAGVNDGSHNHGGFTGNVSQSTSLDGGGGATSSGGALNTGNNGASVTGSGGSSSLAVDIVQPTGTCTIFIKVKDPFEDW